MTEAQKYIKEQLDSGALTLAHIEALTTSYQAGEYALVKDGKPGPKTRAALEGDFPELFKPAGPVPLASLGKWLRLPLPTLPATGSHPQARRPQVTSGFHTVNPSRPTHNGVDLFYRWEPGDEPSFVGDGGCATRLADGSPKWVVPYGIPALAAADGVVQLAGPSPTGFRCWVDHGNGWRTGYFHLERLYVQSGNKVQAGTSLGLVGHNPQDTDARHLHFELSPVDKYAPVDPEPYLQR